MERHEENQSLPVNFVGERDKQADAALNRQVQNQGCAATKASLRAGQAVSRSPRAQRNEEHPLVKTGCPDSVIHTVTVRQKVDDWTRSTRQDRSNTERHQAQGKERYEVSVQVLGFEKSNMCKRRGENQLPLY